MCSTQNVVPYKCATAHMISNKAHVASTLTFRDALLCCGCCLFNIIYGVNLRTSAAILEVLILSGGAG